MCVVSWQGHKGSGADDHTDQSSATSLFRYLIVGRSCEKCAADGGMKHKGRCLDHSELRWLAVQLSQELGLTEKGKEYVKGLLER